MTTLILRTYNHLTTGAEGGHKYLSTKIFYDGVEQSLPIFFKGKLSEEQFKSNSVIAIKGHLREEVKPFTLTLLEASQVEITNEDNWLGFIVQKLLSQNIPAFRIIEYVEGYAISSFLENHHIWFDISSDKLTLKKAEFGRLLPLEKAEYVRKSSSWTKGVFTTSNENFIEFLQTSWDGEQKVKYTLPYSKDNVIIFLKFLQIPFSKGWTELDYRLGKNGFYKSAGIIEIENGKQEWTFTLLDIGEQDIPFITDKIDQWFRTFWGDLFINNLRRHIDKTEVSPIVA
jgi:hypothetical protein